MLKYLSQQISIIHGSILYQLVDQLIQSVNQLQKLSVNQLISQSVGTLICQSVAFINIQ